ncbi:ATP-dependent helicase HrpB [Planctomyces sp. SH-PL14]|uniref:ATP-dependent helicase HrpB n=1 Tax=Planctomyces sp. SH-PL14 TaxID=1632864 RepID=UPI00078E3071|nr:ATP-dependent helicase HrpB [Planctomyces sp. SH-PL14]AMV19494.1 ATP-dependent RNA helicase HrpB [Planctomyces sp. SH-PL14]
MSPALARLPIDDVLPQIVSTLKETNAIVLRAPTGAGKSTRVPPALLDAGLAPKGRIVMLEPRRIAARATARRIAQERGVRLGGEVGYQVRFDEQASRDTKILVVTEGVLLRRLQDDPFLEGIDAVLFDEFHERSLNSDLALAMVRRVQQEVRPDLRIVVMSATIAAHPVAAYLNNCPVIESEGRTYPVEIRYARRFDRVPPEQIVLTGVTEILPKTPGDLLVFLPGAPEIRRAARELEPLARQHDLAVMPLFGDLPPEEQDRVLLPCERRKVVLATNVAETSLTIEGITAVVDTGLAKVMRFDPQIGLDRLELSPISKASADQRAGRAGRTQAGVCLRMWDESAHRARPDAEDAEIRRVDLAGPVLELHCWGESNVLGFPWYEPPREAAVLQAESLLRKLDALDDAGQVTPLGRGMARLPLHPRLARMVLEGQRLGVGSRVALLAAMLSERDPFSGRGGPVTAASHRSQSDVLDRLFAIEEFLRTGRREFSFGLIHGVAIHFLTQAADQIRRSLPARSGAETPVSSDGTGELLRALLAGFPDRLARRRDTSGPRGLMVGGKGVKLGPQSNVSGAEFFLCIDVDGGSTDALVRQASAVEREWLTGPSLVTRDELFFHPSQKQVVARRRTLWDDLVLSEAPAPLPTGDAAAEQLFENARTALDEVFPKNDSETENFLLRVRSLAEWMPELDLPRLDREGLEKVLRDLCDGRRSFAELRSAPWLATMQGQYSYPQRQTIDREAPEKIEVPSGSQIRLQYEAARPPVLAVRIQEVFGMTETPRIAGGRVRVLMHLLAPNMRPQQVTDDLKSFWENAYAEVRKELRRRYPKHQWPEDPKEGVARRRPGKP